MYIDIYEKFLTSEFTIHIEKMIDIDTKDDELNGK